MLCSVLCPVMLLLAIWADLDWRFADAYEEEPRCCAMCGAYDSSAFQEFAKQLTRCHDCHCLACCSEVFSGFPCFT